MLVVVVGEETVIQSVEWSAKLAVALCWMLRDDRAAAALEWRVHAQRGQSMLEAVGSTPLPTQCRQRQTQIA